MILIPAFNEVGAIASVIHEVRGVLPEAPILVVDDASTDGTELGANPQRVLTSSAYFPQDWAEASRHGYKLAYELSLHEYVIRVDGDGQHDPKYIPALVETLRKTGCHMVIGSRDFRTATANTHSSVRARGIWFFRLVGRAYLGKTGARPTSGFVGVNRQALRVFHWQLSVGIPGNRGAGSSQQQRFQFKKSQFRRAPAKLAAAPSPR